MHRNSELLFRKYAFDRILEHFNVLEIGPDRTPRSTYRNMYPDVRSGLWQTIDMVGQTTWRSNNEYSFPIDNSVFDVVLSGQVIEHVRKIWRWMPEVARVCKPGGLIITINPVSWPYHTAPYDCWRIYPEGMAALYDDAGIETILSNVESLDSGVTDTITIGQKR